MAALMATSQGVRELDALPYTGAMARLALRGLYGGSGPLMAVGGGRWMV
jgi:hypothetical protein